MAKETYEVGPVSVLGHEPGEKFEADLKPVQRARLLQSGALKTVTPAPAASENPAAPKGDGDAAPQAGHHKGVSHHG
jgi:hypothetical protein